MLNILDKAKEIENYIINFRRDLHENPELSGQEFETQKKIMKELDKLGITYKKAGNTSLIATLKGGKDGKTVALRGDIDALPVKEETDVEFKPNLSVKKGEYIYTNSYLYIACNDGTLGDQLSHSEGSKLCGDVYMFKLTDLAKFQ